MHKEEIEGQTFVICTERILDDRTGEFTGRWYAWSFFAYDNALNIFPAGAVPKDLNAQESIAGEHWDSEVEARLAVADTLRRVIQTRCLDGTGFYSPPGDFVYPQELPKFKRNP